MGRGWGWENPSGSWDRPHPRVTSAKSQTQPCHFPAFTPLAALPSLGDQCPALQRGCSFPPCPALGIPRCKMRVEAHFNLPPCAGRSAHLLFYPFLPSQPDAALFEVAPSSNPERESPELSRALSLGTGEPLSWGAWVGPTTPLGPESQAALCPMALRAF